MSRVIEVIVAADGSSTIETRGFSGRSCQTASRFLENALGKRSNEQLTAEYFTTTETERQAREQS